MSVRLLSIRLAKHGRKILQGLWRRDIHTNILEPNQNRLRNRLPTSTSIFRSAADTQTAAKRAINATINVNNGHAAATSARNSGIFRFGQHARKLFIDNLLSRVTTTYSSGLREQATKKLFYGDSAPFFALVGVSLASGAGVLTKEDELEGVCWEIREAAGRLQSSWNYDEITQTFDSDFNLDKLNIGPVIAKGCAAVVYAAEFKNEAKNDEQPNAKLTEPVNRSSVSPDARLSNLLQQQSYQPDLMGPLQNMSRFVHNFGGSADNLHVYNQSSAAAVFAEALATDARSSKQHHKVQAEGSATTFGNGDSEGMQSPLPSAKSPEKILMARYPLALKMMFNYDIQSNALAILRGMYKETVPARQRYKNEASTEWERVVQNQTLTLAPHPNIVCMFGFFCDEVGDFPDGHQLYPVAQPQRINPNGYGRNMSLYLLMKRYDYSLRAFLDNHTIDARNRLLLLAQLLEAVAHINRHGVAHRDIKSDNILIELNDDDSAPQLVLSDFGCCLADKVHGLQVPYASYDIDKGGNAALMAPEIINKQPGSFAVLDFAKADLWACGAIAYEIFGLPNPFYSASGGLAAVTGQQTNSLRNSDYQLNDLPPLNNDCPALVQQLIYNILTPNPSKRVSPDIAANVMQLFLWAPSHWLKPGGIPNSPEILQWLLSLTTKVMCECRPTNGTAGVQQYNFQTGGRRTYVEYLLICSFLARARLRRIRGALKWIQSSM